MDVHFHPAARIELDVLSARERRAIDHAVEKLQALGAELPFPHTSHVEGTALFELRPRAGHGQWRAFYQQIGAMMVIAAIGPEAKVDARGFARAVKVPQQRLKALGGAE